MSDETLLYLVPTPIGNLEDITLRAINVLQSVDTILAEDTRKSGILLKHLNISKPLQSYHSFNEHKLVSSLIKRMEAGERLALISDAGTPAISDPGFLLVRESLKKNIKLECLPGPTAFVPALVKSGFSSDRFVFEGFLPVKKGRKSKMEQLSQESRTIILYESPHRIIKTLEQVVELFGSERRVSISRELTKIYEETITGPAQEVHEIFKDKNVKGEIVLVIEGKAD
ncbi:16S rRNA (cytidine(1402)-2'-O)-methyltransferase [soil metagenome]